MSNISLESLWQEVNFVPNNSQRQAIEHIEAPLFLPAGPGSGKTRVLLWRTVNLIVFHDVKPEEIFLSTFTEKAAFQLKQGLQSLLGQVTNHNGKTFDLSGMFIGTVHSLCQKILIDRRFAVNQERTLRPIVLDDLGQYFFIRSNMSNLLEAMSGEIEDVNRLFADKDYVSTSKHIALQNCISLFNRFSEECLEPQDIYDEADDVLKPIIKMYDAYLDKLKHQSILQTDFSLLQTKAFAALENNPEATKIFKHVIIDEYQDTNAIQEKIFFKLAEFHQNLCVVGDDDQALYRFRGATVENFVEFPTRCQKHFGREPRKIPLSTNYRSRKKIVDFYTQFMDYEEWGRSGGDGFYRLVDKEIAAHSEDKHTAVITSSQTTRENAYAEIVPLVQELLNKGKVKDPNQIAFLFPALRNNQAVRLMKSALENAGLKVYAPRAGRFLEVEEAVALMGLYIEIFDRPTREDFKSRDYQDFHSWLDNCETVAAALLKEDKQLKAFVDDRRREIQTAVNDYKRLTEQASKNGWNLDDAYQPETMKRVLSATVGISIAAKKSLANRYFERVIIERLEKGEPFTLSYIISASSSLDWNVLDLFYRLTGFSHFKQMFDLAERGEDEGPVCNLGLISEYLARYLEEFTSILTGRFIGEESFIRTFYLTFLFSIFRLGESEYEDADDPFPKGRIPFLTIHQSKGLEFPVIVLPSVYKKDWGIPKVEKLVRPLLDREGEPLDRINRFDTMRLFYVALSRAENLLVIADAKGRGISMDPAFKGILADQNLTRIENFDVSSLPVAKIESGDIPRNYSYTSDYLQYQKCPRQYMLFRKYGFVASRSQTQFFGTLVHQTLEDLHLLLISQRKKKEAKA